jgi:hypothetical protein
MSLKIAPIDAALLSLVQLVQPASPETIFQEAQGTIVLKILKAEDIHLHLERLEKDRFLLRTHSDCFVVAPKSYDLLTKSLPAKHRDKARLLFLNEQRFK